MKKSYLHIVRVLFMWCTICSMVAWAETPTNSAAITQQVKQQLDLTNLPEHIAIIMDGNGRWATKQGKPRVFGHQNSIQSVREVVEACGALGIPYLTLWAFSTENWGRPQAEVAGLMNLIVTTINKELAELVAKDVHLSFIGDLTRLPVKCQKVLHKAMKASEKNKGLRLTIALSYSGKWDIITATKAIVKEVQAGNLTLQEIDDDVFRKYLATGDIPDPVLLIRTSGEMRLSNFLMMQLAYTELFFTPVLWPDFKKKHLYEAILDYQSRERRFGQLGAST